jgi:hypothetical protein
MNTSDFYATHHDPRLRHLGSRLSTQRAEQPASKPSRFAHLRPAAVPAPVAPNLYDLLDLPDPSQFAKAMIAAGARARGEKPPATWIATPRQTTHCVTGSELMRVARRQGLAT